jgi:predicted dehydrogenase
MEPRNIWGKLKTVQEENLIESERGNYTALYQNLYKAIAAGEALAVKPEQARDVIRIIEAAQQSQDERRVVTFG